MNAPMLKPPHLYPVDTFPKIVREAGKDATTTTLEPSEIVANTAFAAVRSHRLSIRMPKLSHYEVDAVLNQIAAKAVPYQCGKCCSQCDSYKAYTRASGSITIECGGTVGRRERELKYYFKKLDKAIQLGFLQVWNRDFTESNEPPAYDPTDVCLYRRKKYWMESSFFFPEDLARFCDFEKIQLIIYDPNQSDSSVMASTKVSHEECQSSYDADTAPSTMPDIGHDDFPRTALKKKKQRRFDMIGAEIHGIMGESPFRTPTQVMKILIGRAGHENSCVVANDGDSVRWEDARGRKIALTQDMLNDRLRRWHMLNNPTDAPDGKF